jgi:hypothetical protein
MVLGAEGDAPAPAAGRRRHFLEGSMDEIVQAFSAMTE